MKGHYQDPKNGLFSEVFKVLFILGILMEYAFFNWVFNKNSEILLKDEAAKQLANNVDNIDRFTKNNAKQGEINDSRLFYCLTVVDK